MNKELSVMKEFFLGKLTTENLFPYPEFSPEEEDTLKMVLESIDRFMETKAEDFRKYDEQGYQPEDYIQQLKELGLFALVIPEEYEGIGLSNRGYSRALQQIGYYDASTALTVGAHSSIGMRGLLLFGNDQQKAKYLPKLASGEMIAAFCLTESGAGSDAASITTKAERDSEGNWILNGEKIWITNGPFAEFFTVFAKTESGEKGKISAFIVEKSFDGVSSGPKEDKMGIRSSATSTITFNNVKVPAENLLGEEGKGFKIAVSILNSGRTGLGGGCVGAMKSCIRMSTEHAVNRKQFGVPIADFQLIQSKIARMTMECFVTESFVNHVAYLNDSGVEDYSLEAAASKIFSTESLWRVADEALQISGGNGFMREFKYERIVRDSRINRIFEGTNEILRLFIALTGYKHLSPYLKELGNVSSSIFNDPIKGFGLLSSYTEKRYRELTGNPENKLAVAEELKESAQILEEYLMAFSAEVETLVKKYRKEIIGQQLKSARIADVATDLFAGLATLSRVQQMIDRKSAKECQTEIELVNLFMQTAKRRMNQNLRRISRNEDEEISKISEKIVDQQAYLWDLF